MKNENTQLMIPLPRSSDGFGVAEVGPEFEMVAILSNDMGSSEGIEWNFGTGFNGWQVVTGPDQDIAMERVPSDKGWEEWDCKFPQVHFPPQVLDGLHQNAKYIFKVRPVFLGCKPMGAEAAEALGIDPEIAGDERRLNEYFAQYHDAYEPDAYQCVSVPELLYGPSPLPE